MPCLGHVTSATWAPTPGWHLRQRRLWQAFWRKAVPPSDGQTCRATALSADSVEFLRPGVCSTNTNLI